MSDTKITVAFVKEMTKQAQLAIKSIEDSAKRVKEIRESYKKKEVNDAQD